MTQKELFLAIWYRDPADFLEPMFFLVQKFQEYSTNY